MSNIRCFSFQVTRAVAPFQSRYHSLIKAVVNGHYAVSLPVSFLTMRDASINGRGTFNSHVRDFIAVVKNFYEEKARSVVVERQTSRSRLR